MKPDAREALILGALTLLIGFTLLTPLVAEALPSFKTIAVGKLLRADASQGYIKFSATLYFTGYIRNNGINDFINLRLGTTSYIMPHLGLCSDTLGANVTLTSIQEYSVAYTVTGAASTRVWCPDRGEPLTVTGATTMIWDNAAQVATLKTLGPGTITLTWTPASTGIDTTNFYNAFALLSVVPIIIGAIVIIGVLSGHMGGGDAASAAILALVFSVAGVLAVIVINRLLAGI